MLNHNQTSYAITMYAQGLTASFIAYQLRVSILVLERNISKYITL